MGTHGDADEDRAAVRRVVQDFEAALDADDVDALRLLCVDDLVFRGSGEGEESVGPEELLLMLSELRRKLGPDLVRWTLVPHDDHAVTVRGDAAVVTSSATFGLELTSGSRSGRYLQTYVLHRASQGWTLWAYHGSEPQPW